MADRCRAARAAARPGQAVELINSLVLQKYYGFKHKLLNEYTLLNVRSVKIILITCKGENTE